MTIKNLHLDLAAQSAGRHRPKHAEEKVPETVLLHRR